MGLYSLQKLRDLISDNKPIIFPTVLGLIFFVAAIHVFLVKNLLGGFIFLASALFLFYAARHHYKARGTSAYGDTITTEPWEMMPKWKKWAIYIFIILFILIWAYLAMKGISEQGLHLENVCIGSC